MLLSPHSQSLSCSPLVYVPLRLLRYVPLRDALVPPQGAIRHSPVPPTDPFAPLACSCQLDPPAPDSNTAPRGLRSARTRAAPLRHPTPTDHQSRYSLTKVYRGSPGYVFLYSLRFFRVWQGPELHLQSNSLAVCSRDAPSPRCRVAPTLSLGLAPSPILSGGPRPCPRIAPQDVSTVGPSGPNRQLRRSGGGPLASPAVLGPTALEPPRSAAPPVATTSIAGRLPYSPGAARLQERCLAAPRLGATTLWPLPALQQPRGGPSGVPRRPAPSALTPRRIAARSEAAAPAACPGPRLPCSPTGRFRPRHSPGLPRGPTLARPLPLAQHLRSDLDRPGESALLDVFSPAPPEREIQACAISGSLATPPQWRKSLHLD
ncbi:hypothetical protein NDU88_006347 [Pleurodeles waltl]|uniref:Uncharacterized protein n=1 Tax=Pleurodeles waltl TaxID=8319 RepID=A0AAV7TWW9_PLEWA|nr:hypothetical protein NDU88_006347 [Pleurodeles waltl]